MKLTKEVRFVFAEDGFDAIEEHFKNKTESWHAGILDCYEGVNAFTKIDAD